MSAVAAEPRLFNAADAARYLGTTERHIRELVYRRGIPFVKVGRALRFDAANTTQAET